MPMLIQIVHISTVQADSNKDNTILQYNIREYKYTQNKQTKQAEGPELERPLLEYLGVSMIVSSIFKEQSNRQKYMHKNMKIEDPLISTSVPHDCLLLNKPKYAERCLIRYFQILLVKKQGIKRFVNSKREIITLN